MSRRAEEVDNLKHAMWHNMPRWPTTMGPCKNGCNKQARGGGRCMDCLEKDLAAYVGADLALKYRLAIRGVRQLEDDMDIKIGAV